MFIAPATAEEFASLPLAGTDDTAVASVIVGDYGERWNFAELNRGFRLLMHETALKMLDAAPGETPMIGDDIKGDIAGAQDAGIAAALVRTGKFRPRDLDGDVRPQFVLESIGELPRRWAEIEHLLHRS